MFLSFRDPVDHAFDFTRQSEIRMHREPEFRSEYETVRAKCREFAVAVLDSCRNSGEVEQVIVFCSMGL